MDPPTRRDTRTRCHVVIRGAVQGVGFRPFVFRRATALGLGGWVANSSQGVIVEAEGHPEILAALLAQMRCCPPPNARVIEVQIREIPSCGESAFSIRPSVDSDIRSAEVLPDLATCGDCLAELFDPANRRYLYPFTNCTQCGPRYSIIENIPYDRSRTSMRYFSMCEACRVEYDNPLDRRFHAEPNACPLCGPRVTLWNAAGAALAESHAALLEACRAIRSGHIVALKGIGGFQLIADACNAEVVRRLRLGKQRVEKPFAVMFASLAQVHESCRV